MFHCHCGSSSYQLLLLKMWAAGGVVLGIPQDSSQGITFKIQLRLLFYSTFLSITLDLIKLKGNPFSILHLCDLLWQFQWENTAKFNIVSWEALLSDQLGKVKAVKTNMETHPLS